MYELTVLMGVYNEEDFLHESIQSICDQTYRDFEFLIIDDASTDNSLSIIEEYAKRDNRIRLVSLKQNHGLGYVLNHGLKIASGKYIARMDGDDIAFPQRLQIQMSIIKKSTNIDIIGSWAVDIDEFGNEGSKRMYPTQHEEIKKLIWTNPIIHPTTLFRKEAIMKIGGYTTELNRKQDYELWFRCSRNGLRFLNYPKVLIKYRIKNKSQSWNSLFTHLKVGYKGCITNKLGIRACIGIFFPLFVKLTPNVLTTELKNIVKNLDPRYKQIN